MTKRSFIDDYSNGIITAFKESILTDQAVNALAMNKPLDLEQTTAKQSAMANKVNRNLSPSLARIQNLKPKAVPSHNESTTDKNDNISSAPEPRPGAARADVTQGLSAGSTSNAQNIFQPPPTEVKHHTPASSVAIAPWIIASITLTLALFSGNYAWQTQKQVETLSLRLEQLETQTTTPPTTELQEGNGNAVKTEQALLNLKLTQDQQASKISALQNDFAADTELTNSRLKTLEDNITNLANQAQAASLHIEKETSLTQRIDSKRNTARTIDKAHGEMDSNSKNESLENTEAIDSARVKKWSINIASFSDPNTANSIYKKVQKVATSASKKPITVNGKTLYRIRAEGYDSRGDAEQEALTLQARLGLSGLWVSRD